MATASYDPLGHQVAETNPVSGTSLITYSATEKTAAQDPQGNVTQYSYDPAGRLLTVQDAANGVTQYQYDNVDNTTAITSGDGTTPSQVETRQYDAQDRVISETVSEPGLTPQTTRTAYDQDGNVAQVGQPNGDVTYNTYDLADRLSQVQLDQAAVAGGAGTTSSLFEGYNYDNADNVTSSSDFNNYFDQYSPDGADRVGQEVDSNSSTVVTTTTSFDPDGNTLSRTTQTQNSSGPLQTATYTATVNAADWPTVQSDNGVRTSYGYDGAGQTRTETILNGVTPITNTLNAEGLVTATSESLGVSTPYTNTFAYNADDLPLTTTLKSGTTQAQETAQYDADSRLTQLRAVGPATATAPLSSTYSYAYNAVGWTTGVTSNLNGVTTTQTITHDGLGRLTGVQSGSSTQSWTYDGNGNLLTSASSGVTTTYGYSPSVGINAVVALSTTGQPTTYFGYNSNGDTTSITNTGTISTGLGYDGRARLAGVTLKDGTSVSLSYNAAGQRSRYVVSKPGQPTLTQTFTYRGNELGQAVVVTGTTTYTDTYIYTQAGLPLELLRQQNGTTSRYWYVLDGRGNVVALTDVTGTVVDRYAYDVWGRPTSVSESVPQRLRYAGYWWDQELGWYWVSIRMYDPSLKRWLQPDPSQQDGVRTYVYVSDDPMDATDPSGLVVYYSPHLVNGQGTDVQAVLTLADMLLVSGGGTNPTGLGKKDWTGCNPSNLQEVCNQGHLLGHRFGGSDTNPANLVWMRQKTNFSTYKRLENQVARQLLPGRAVAYEATAIYDHKTFYPKYNRVTAGVIGGPKRGRGGVCLLFDRIVDNPAATDKPGPFETGPGAALRVRC